MSHWLIRFVRIMFIIATVSLLCGKALAVDAVNVTSPENTVNTAEELNRLQKQLDNIKQEVAETDSESKLGQLSSSVLDLGHDTDALLAILQRQQSQLETQLSVLGPEPEIPSETETSEVKEKRTSLTNEKNKVDEQIALVSKIKEQSTNLSVQIVNLRRDSLKTQLALNSGTVLKPQFWLPLIQPDKEDQYRLNLLSGQLKSSFQESLAPEWRVGSLALLICALLLATLGSRIINQVNNWIGVHIVPEGHLRRSFFACATVLTTVLVAAGSVHLIAKIFTRLDGTPLFIDNIVSDIIKLTIFCALLAGVGKAFLSTDRPSWRLPGIANPVALAMKPFPFLSALIIFIFGVIEFVNISIGASLSTTVVTNAISALLIALITFTIAVRGSQQRKLLLAHGEKPESRSTLAGLIHLSVILTSLAIFMALATGYIALARFLTYELLWVGTVLSCLYLLMNLTIDIIDVLFSPDTTSGKRIKSMLNLDDRHLAQANSLLMAISKVTLILFAIASLLNGTFGTTTPLELLHSATTLWGGKGFEQFNIVPTRLINAMIFLGISVYILRVSRRWLEADFLPQTTMDSGIQASLVTLFMNLGYVVILLVVLATLGVQWNNLAWIVSALSVGIGFGLQEIVKNFISGLILLTERPVKVGDLVSISGIEGDIRRINVRATEIQLSDRSTVIVPNSQLISQNVRNVTMGDAQGVVTIELKFPLTIEPEEVRDLLLEAYTEHDSILTSPAPSVRFKQLETDGIIMSVTGYVRTPRLVGITKSDLLFDILKRLRASENKPKASQDDEAIEVDANNDDDS